jgi:hypothetical protein
MPLLAGETLWSVVFGGENVSPIGSQPTVLLPCLGDCTTEVAGDISDALQTLWTAVGSTHLTPTSLIGRSSTTEVTIPLVITGSSTDPMPSPGVALLVQKRTGLSGRANRGRSYWPGIISEARVDDSGQISSDTLASLVEAFEAFKLAMAEGPGGLAIFHSDGSAGTVVTSYIPQGTVATQRRRLRG